MSDTIRANIQDEELAAKLTERDGGHDLGVEKFGYLQAEELTRCEMSPDFQQVTSIFADGTEVSADLTTKELIVNGKRIEKPAGSIEA